MKKFTNQEEKDMTIEARKPVKDLPSKKKKVVETKTRAVQVGLDVGTMNLCGAKTSKEGIDLTILRNMFLKIDPEHADSLDLKNISHVIIDDEIVILAEDSYNFGNIFNQQVSRPMKDGVISSDDIDSTEIVAMMIKGIIGVGDGTTYCCYSVPANPLDRDFNNIYHEQVFGRIVQQCNYIPLPLNEAVAVIYSQCEDDDFTGIAISMGAGMVNVAVVFKSVPVLTFSVARSGDWIDKNVAEQTGTEAVSRVTRIKEKSTFHLADFKVDAFGKQIKNKKEIRIREALIHYYGSMIRYVTDHIVRELDKLDIDFPEDIPVIISGGTSRAKGIIEMVKGVFENYEFPFEISEVRHASDPMTAVAEGCLIKAYKEESKKAKK